MQPGRRVLVNVAHGSWFPDGQKRLEDSLARVAYRDHKLLFGDRAADKWPSGCPTHQAAPYGFKTGSLAEAGRRGFDVVVWCDSSLWFLKNPDPLFLAIEEQGYWICTQGWTVGQWCADHALGILGITREEAMPMQLVAGGMYGFDLRQDIGRRYLAWCQDKLAAGAFPGPWYRKDGFVSADTRVLGHRHDMPVLSVFAHRNGLKIALPPTLWGYAVKDRPVADVTLALVQGMR